MFIDKFKEVGFTKTCNVCGEKFIAKQDRKVTCTPCIKKRHQVVVPNKVKVTKNCVICGIEFITKQDRKIYCVPCLKKVWAEKKVK